MTNTLMDSRVANLLNRLFAEAEKTDAEVLAPVKEQVSAKSGTRPNEKDLAKALDTAFLPVSPDVGRFIYTITRTIQPKLIVEFGTSFGLGAIHFAAALRDNGGGRLITTELNEEKSRRAKEHVSEAGLADLVEFRQGDAFETLKPLRDPINILFLDGWKTLYLPMLKMLQPNLAAGGLVIGDDTREFPERLAYYLAYVRDPRNGYLSLDLPLGDGIEFSLRV